MHFLPIRTSLPGNIMCTQAKITINYLADFKRLIPSIIANFTICEFVAAAKSPPNVIMGVKHAKYKKKKDAKH